VGVVNRLTFRNTLVRSPRRGTGVLCQGEQGWAAGRTYHRGPSLALQVCLQDLGFLGSRQAL
jgi:hypothetical protein